MEQKFELTPNQVQDFNQSLLDRIKSWLKKLFGSGDGQTCEKNIEDVISQPENDEEKELLDEVFDEIHTFHQKRKEFEQSGKKIEGWYDDEIRRITQTVKPNATEEDVDSVKEAIAKSIDDEISEEIDALHQLAEEGKEDNE